MIKKFISKKEKNFYIIILSAIFIIIALISLNKYTSINVKEYKNITQQINKYKQQNKEKAKEISHLQSQINFFYNKVINKNEITREMKQICSILTQKKLLKICEIQKVAVPLKYINVATIQINTNGKLDDRILGWFLYKTYNIKKYKSNNTNVTVEIYKNIK